jgi:lipoprotein NlpI
MRTFIALGLCTTLTLLAGCVTEATEAVEATPVVSAPQQQSAGHEVWRMFADEKARAAASELPGQF